MKVQTGQGTIPLITLIGIWSISALNALPGLAVSPILGKLSTIFPGSTELDIQMLSSLPSLLIIPFIILSGKLTEKINIIKLLQIGLVIFSLSGLLYLFIRQNVATDRCKCTAGHRVRINRSLVNRAYLSLFHRWISDKTIRIQFSHH